MSISNSTTRVTEYFRRHGLGATLRRAALASKRAIFARRMVVFYCDLDDRKLPPVNRPGSIVVKRVNALTELSAEHLEALTGFWNPNQARKNIKERFAKGASLWLAESEGRLAGFGWTLQGGTIEPYYFPLTPDDVHFFDFHVFPQYRGQGINPCLTGRILECLAAHGSGRAFIEAAEWNVAQLTSLRKTPFRGFGLVRSFRIPGCDLVSWNRDPQCQSATSAENPADRTLNMANER